LRGFLFFKYTKLDDGAKLNITRLKCENDSADWSYRFEKSTDLWRTMTLLSYLESGVPFTWPLNRVCVSRLAGNNEILFGFPPFFITL
jgi:hypothetical protein